MKNTHGSHTPLTAPEFIKCAAELSSYLKSLNETELGRVMKVSPELARKTKLLIRSWSRSSTKLSPAVDCFLGDIYSGLQAQSLSKADRQYAQKHLRILSGFYGLLRPLDGICPYRLEMGYKLPDAKFRNLYSYWGDRLARSIEGQDIVNLTSAEYSKAILPYVDKSKVVTPKFLTVNPKTKEPGFVVVHAKIARGAYANWLIKQRIDSFDDLAGFGELNYRYSKKLSSSTEPVFVAKNFGGLGLSVRLNGA